VKARFINVVLRIIAGILIGLLCFALGVFIHGFFFDGDTIVTLNQPVFVWVFGILGFGVGYRYASKIYEIFIDNIWQLF